MNKLFMSEVHQVVDNELVVAISQNRFAVARPFRVGHLMHVWNQVGVSKCWVTQPNPNISVASHGRKRRNGCTWVDGFLRRHRNAATSRVINDAVIWALNAVFANGLAHRQRCQAVPAGISKGNRVAILGSINSKWAVANCASNRSSGDFVIPGGHVPSVKGIVGDLCRGRAAKILCAHVVPQPFRFRSVSKRLLPPNFGLRSRAIGKGYYRYAQAN